jgi:hypothetical protein
MAVRIGHAALIFMAGLLIGGGAGVLLVICAAPGDYRRRQRRRRLPDRGGVDRINPASPALTTFLPTGFMPPLCWQLAEV